MRGNDVKHRGQGLGRVAAGLCWSLPVVLALGLAGCGGGSKASRADSGADKTYLSAEAVDADGDTLSYEWRATAGSIENRNSPKTVWAMPPGPGLHFAYLTVTDGRGGQATYQYAVSSDKINNPAPVPGPVNYTSSAALAVNPADEVTGATVRLRVYLNNDPSFAGSPAAARRVFLPDVRVQVFDPSDLTQPVFSGTTDLGGEVAVPALKDGVSYQLSCTDTQGAAFVDSGEAAPYVNGCALLDRQSESFGQSLPVTRKSGAERNLQLYGHVGLQDGGVCAATDAFFGANSTATVQLLNADSTPASPAVRVNIFGDYALDASVSQSASLKARITCGSHVVDKPLTAPGGGYVTGTRLEASHVVPNSRPQILRMVATGPEGNVRGLEVLPEDNAFSSGMPGSAKFLTYKGQDTRLSACMYYRSFGAVESCDAQGRMVNPISLDDWKRQVGLSSYNRGTAEWSATYINRRDLNLVRRMVATQTDATHIAFVVCNTPGPQTGSQREIDSLIDTALADEKRVACVAMEYTPTAGRSSGQPFTKFLTFGPNGNLISSVNLDGRGEKFMPGACVACHGGAKYMGRFPELGNPSPDIQAKFQAFDTANYAFSSKPGLGEADQSEAIYQLNQLVLKTQPATATVGVINGWYAGGSHVLNKQYVPSAWDQNLTAQGVSQADSQRFYRSVVATSCRTCHGAMRDAYNWDAAGGGGTPLLLGRSGSAHICGGGVDLHVNGSMPNALASVDRLQQTLKADPDLEAVMTTLLGCTQAKADPVYPKH